MKGALRVSMTSVAFVLGGLAAGDGVVHDVGDRSASPTLGLYLPARQAGRAPPA